MRMELKIDSSELWVTATSGNITWPESLACLDQSEQTEQGPRQGINDGKDGENTIMEFVCVHKKVQKEHKVKHVTVYFENLTQKTQFVDIIWRISRP